MYTLPIIGSHGLFELAEPFGSLMSSGIEYECQAIRRINEYLSANEDVKAIAYSSYGLPDDVYEEDLKANAYIVSLQSAKGHWLYVPYRYIVSYPVGNGIAYNSRMLTIALPSLYKEQDLTGTINDIKTIILSQLGVECHVKEVATSLPVLVKQNKHIETQSRRDAEKRKRSLLAEQTRLSEEVYRLLQENALLKEHIKRHP